MVDTVQVLRPNRVMRMYHVQGLLFGLTMKIPQVGRGIPQKGIVLGFYRKGIFVSLVFCPADKANTSSTLTAFSANRGACLVGEMKTLFLMR